MSYSTTLSALPDYESTSW